MKAQCYVFALLLIAIHTHAAPKSLNGFDLKGSLVDIEAIQAGGPPRDAIPAINTPVFIAAEKDHKNSSQTVLAINHQGVQRAYPINILTWHEIVNDTIHGKKLLISYCPLCGSGVAFESDVEGFGVSGLLYNSDLLLYDRKTESLWSQIDMQAISGPRKGEKLTYIPVEHTSLKSWLARFPSSSILSENTGFHRDYTQNPYAGYEKSPQTYFKVLNKAPGPLHPKALVFGVKVNGATKAYPLETLNTENMATITDTLEGISIKIIWHHSGQSASLHPDSVAAGATAIQLYWFAWYAFHPATALYQPQ